MGLQCLPLGDRRRAAASQTIFRTSPTRPALDAATIADTLLHCRKTPMPYAVLQLLHLLSAIVWVGGMVFAHFFLRPAAQALEPPQRLRLMRDVLRRFLAAVLLAVGVLLASGGWMIGLAAQAAGASGGRFAMPPGWTVMATLGLAMAAIFGHIRFALYPRLARAVEAADWPAGGQAMARIRTWVGVNLGLGLAAVAAVRLL